jgi:hypothetical protein
MLNEQSTKKFLLPLKVEKPLNCYTSKRRFISTMKLPALLLILSASTLLAWEDDCLLDPVVTKVGDHAFFSTGGSALTIGRNTLFSDGESATNVGKNTFFSDGVTATKIGKNTFFSDGDVATTIGKNTFFSDGAIATKIGKNTFVDGGDCAEQELVIKAIAIPDLLGEDEEE